ncbi:unnamed protein product [Phytophthora fragariaefolia]|uniref:Unnamed protein product n=1 Tax=Phytophthora fragariaefolia TaxID=1490495 RepID=A0A9W6XXA0_9STRA|nr:unnamed protein product [Phytophthora fragariaefolia]
MEHKFPASDKYQHMLKKVYRELMVLGLISLGLKILKENPDIDSYSKTMLAFQVADLTIFFLALALILQSTAVFWLLRNQNDRADRAELMKTLDLIKLVNNADTNSGPSFFQTLLCCGRESKKHFVKKLVELRLLRRLFLHRFGFPQLFPFAKYLSRAQANQISHMIEVEPSMWVVLLAVAWGICGLLNLLEALDADMPERQELVEAFMFVAWILMLLHLMVFLYFRSCVHYLLRLAAINEDKTILTANLHAIAEEEAKAWKNEEADKALEIMSSIQEEHEEFEYQRAQRQRKLAQQDGGVVGSVCRRILTVFGISSANSDRTSGCESVSGVVPGSPHIDIRFFSYKAWHVSVILLLVLNGFLITLFVQCAVYDLDEIYEDFGTIPTLLVPLPLVLNGLFFQRHIFYDFVVVSSTLRIDSHTLSDVVENFSEVVRLRAQFASTLHQHLTHQELTIADLQEELKARDTTGSGRIEVDDLRSVLGKFGFHLTRFRFNSVVKMLFELEGTSVSYSQVIRLVVMAQNEHLVENTPGAEYPAHPLLRPSVLIFDNLGQSSVLSQSNYNLFASTRQIPIMTQSSMRAESNPDGFQHVPASSLLLSSVSQHVANRNNTQQPAMPRPSVSSQALHDVFILERLSTSQTRPDVRRL